MHTKQPSTLAQDVADPGWREREAERMRKLFEAVPLHVPRRAVIAKPRPVREWCSDYHCAGDCGLQGHD